ncbi:phage shock protein operon transcriptional activator [Vibrio vulnificus]|uniref:phage shock protein operon transcriptional activator n=1 Tax=Vibrio vulnificus TaxID=672 RepID=UPI0007EE8ED5|nr:phage shock protein operon transcriptional activator [Vibrio vulnificus]ANN26880.1 Psp operon transcriptional activator [Vibrio vulnificus]EGR0056040.1 phage shock protein operon transcriptional activator [Vibrio vulnificus]EGR0787722.1 phage shock protein operon transcriptional activator [Vibrio vulnificus]EGR0798959.1 phage shock protein operon transcriptional activator [Vibrio vulnificus]EGR0815984.1 phage shock protein operon transcriptional activator [Vibrio vulnificus]
MKQNLIGESPAFLSVLDKVSKLAPIERPILIIGERGTGKELIAQRLHYLSKRWDKPLLSLNCATLSEGLIDSELFGHESGSFTGSKGKHKGRFERAEGGTLFLDELATAPLMVQEKLLRVIEYGEYERVGGHQPLTADVRLVCATNADLVKMAEEGQFRADLLDRLAFDVITLPPLRERQEDILLLAEHYAIKMCRELKLDYFVGFTSHANEQLTQYRWPGNVRELKNVVERAIYRHGLNPDPIDELIFNPFATGWESEKAEQEQPNASSTASSSTSNDQVSSPATTEISFPIDYKQWQEEQDIKLLNQALEASKFNQRQAADLLGLSYHQFRGMVRKYALVGQN